MTFEEAEASYSREEFLPGGALLADWKAERDQFLIQLRNREDHIRRLKQGRKLQREWLEQANGKQEELIRVLEKAKAVLSGEFRDEIEPSAPGGLVLNEILAILAEVKGM